MAETMIVKLIIAFNGGQYIPLTMSVETALKEILHIKGIIEKRNLKEEFPSVYNVHCALGQQAVIDMVSVVGAYIAELPKDYQEEFLKNQTAMKEIVEKHLGEGEGWKQ